MGERNCILISVLIDKDFCLYSFPILISYSYVEFHFIAFLVITCLPGVSQCYWVAWSWTRCPSVLISIQRPTNHITVVIPNNWNIDTELLTYLPTTHCTVSNSPHPTTPLDRFQGVLGQTYTRMAIITIIGTGLPCLFIHNQWYYRRCSTAQTPTAPIHSVWVVYIVLAPNTNDRPTRRELLLTVSSRGA